VSLQCGRDKKKKKLIFGTWNVRTHTLHFTRRISIVTAVRFVIVDFKEMNE